MTEISNRNLFPCLIISLLSQKTSGFDIDLISVTLRKTYLDQSLVIRNYPVFRPSDNFGELNNGIAHEPLLCQ